mmetsp:Transcript_39926/g.128695  ORF Transcript_39926/g.128695 Transcript_39926/m.128695 type:complete len:266 (-) Transcript_39926:10-807(-)
MLGRRSSRKAPAVSARDAPALAAQAAAAELARLAARRAALQSQPVARKNPRVILRPNEPWLLELDDDTFGALCAAVLCPLDPRGAGRLASCCRALRERLRAPLAALQAENRGVRSLCAKAGSTCAALLVATRLVWGQRSLSDADAAVLASLARRKQLERLTYLGLRQNRISDGGVCALAAALRGGSMRRLKVLDLSGNRVGAEGRRALGNALEAPGALPSLISLSLNNAAGERRLTLEEAKVLAQQSAHAQRHKRLLSAKGLVPQ